MKPILFGPKETSFTSKGLGTISDAVLCIVEEERNGIYDLVMQIPEQSKHFSDIKLECNILAKPNPYNVAQPFRIHRISKPMDGIVTIYANHISYDLKGIPVNPFIANSCSIAVAKLKSESLIACPFTLTTDIDSSAIMTVAKPYTIRDLMGSMRGSLIDTYGGEYQFNKFTIRLLSERGRDRGVRIKYGVNLIDLKQEEYCTEVYTGVLPYYASEKGIVVGDIQRAPGNYDVERILPLDLTSDYVNEYTEEDTLPTVAQLNAAGASYVVKNRVGVPKVSLNLSFAQLQRKEVRLCDTVTVEFERMGIETTAKVISTKYDVLEERYISVKIGDPRANIVNSLQAEAEARAEADDRSRSYLEKTDAAIRAEVTRSIGAENALSARITLNATDIMARVTKTGGSNSSFAWSLQDNNFSLIAGDATVFQCTSAGIEVDGKITARSGYIGNGSSGFEIGSTSIKNGMTSLSDTSHNGVYVGTDGIALGKGAFKVTSAGAVAASNLALTGGSISIKDSNGNVAFSVSSTGSLKATTGTFSGTVYAGRISYGGDAGTFSGAGITAGTIGTGSGTALTSTAVGGIGWGNNFGSMTQKAYTAAAVQTDYLHVTAGSIWVGSNFYGNASNTFLTGVTASLTHASPYYIYAMNSAGDGAVAIPHVIGVSLNTTDATAVYLGSNASPV